MSSQQTQQARAIHGAAIINLIDNLRASLKENIDKVAGLSGDMYPRTDVGQILSDVASIFTKLTTLIVYSASGPGSQAGGYLQYRIAVIKDLMTRRIITKERLNKCIVRVSTAYDFAIGDYVFEMQKTIWGGARDQMSNATILSEKLILAEQMLAKQSEKKEKEDGEENESNELPVWGGG